MRVVLADLVEQLGVRDELGLVRQLGREELRTLDGAVFATVQVNELQDTLVVDIARPLVDPVDERLVLQRTGIGHVRLRGVVADFGLGRRIGIASVDRRTVSVCHVVGVALRRTGTSGQRVAAVEGKDGDQGRQEFGSQHGHLLSFPRSGEPNHLIFGVCNLHAFGLRWDVYFCHSHESGNLYYWIPVYTGMTSCKQTYHRNLFTFSSLLGYWLL